MANVPLGGMDRVVESGGAVSLFDTEFEPAIFLAPAVDTVYPAGTLLGRITASDKLTPSIAASVDGSEIPVAVLNSQVTSGNPVVDQSLEAIVSGRVRLAKLSMIDAAPITDAVKDSLRDYGIRAVATTDLSKLDN